MATVIIFSPPEPGAQVTNHGAGGGSSCRGTDNFERQSNISRTELTNTKTETAILFQEERRTDGLFVPWGEFSHWQARKDPGVEFLGQGCLSTSSDNHSNKTTVTSSPKKFFEKQTVSSAKEFFVPE